MPDLFVFVVLARLSCATRHCLQNSIRLMPAELLLHELTHVFLNSAGYGQFNTSPISPHRHPVGGGG